MLIPTLRRSPTSDQSIREYKWQNFISSSKFLQTVQKLREVIECLSIKFSFASLSLDNFEYQCIVYISNSNRNILVLYQKQLTRENFNEDPELKFDL